MAALSLAELHRARKIIYGHGIIGFPQTLRVDLVGRLREDVEAVFQEALDYPGGTINRGHNRHYFIVHPERLRGFLELVSAPVVTELSAFILGPDWQIVELAVDVPRPGAVHQRWHRDFPMGPETRDGHFLSSLAFNIPLPRGGVTREMGPLEFVPRTQWEPGDRFEAGMFPPADEWPRYEAGKEERLAAEGTISARTALAIHRGTPNTSDVDRFMIILGVVDSVDCDGGRHELIFTREYHSRLPDWLKPRLKCRLVDQLEPIVHEMDIEGLQMV